MKGLEHMTGFFRPGANTSGQKPKTHKTSYAGVRARCLNIVPFAMPLLNQKPFTGHCGALELGVGLW